MRAHANLADDFNANQVVTHTYRSCQNESMYVVKGFFISRALFMCTVRAQKMTKNLICLSGSICRCFRLSVFCVCIAYVHTGIHHHYYRHYYYDYYVSICACVQQEGGGRKKHYVKWDEITIACDFSPRCVCEFFISSNYTRRQGAGNVCEGWPVLSTMMSTNLLYTWWIRVHDAFMRVLYIINNRNNVFLSRMRTSNIKVCTKMLNVMPFKANCEYSRICIVEAKYRIAAGKMVKDRKYMLSFFSFLCAIYVAVHYFWSLVSPVVSLNKCSCQSNLGSKVSAREKGVKRASLPLNFWIWHHSLWVRRFL